MLIGVSSQVRGEISGRVGVVGLDRCSRIAVSFEIVLGCTDVVLVVRIDDGHLGFAECLRGPSGRGQVGGIATEVAGVGVHQRPPPLR